MFKTGFAVLLAVAAMAVRAAAPAVVEPPPKENEWGFRPATGETVRTTPAPFVWREQPEAAVYELEYARDPAFTRDCRRYSRLRWNACCPDRIMTPGVWYWRMRFTDRRGETSRWSGVRSFTIAPDAVAAPMPDRRELLARVPQTHPRIFLRPEQLPELRRRAAAELKPVMDEMIRQCDALLKNPPDTTEPPKYPAGIARSGKEWQKIWWGNRLRVIKVLDGAATLGFCYRLTGNRAYGELARKILMECARWDPVGATGGRYNDEAGMPYLSRFSRTYSYVNDLLSEDERRECRRVIAIRGDEFYRLLCPGHFYRPYVSHNNRAWHFLGEAGLVFLNEIPAAADWLHLAMSVYFCVYPVWGDDDGGWHEGLWYWNQYLERFFWWGDIMKNTFRIDIADKPFFAQTGYYAMYLQPPGTPDGGFGDLAELSRGHHNANVMRALAALSGNPCWKWYADRMPVKKPESLYITFMRGTYPAVKAEPPTRLPTSRCFRGNGLVFMNTDLTDAADNVQLLFKSSPRGTASHGYDANNSFILNAFGERLLIHSGTRDNWGSNFHRNWLWDTRSTNCVTVDGVGQFKNSFRAKGQITAFSTDKDFTYACGEAAASYPQGKLTVFRRRILFCQPSALLLIDTLKAPVPSTFSWHLHALKPFVIAAGQRDIRLTNGAASCRIDFLAPARLAVSRTDRFDPPPPSYSRQPVQDHLTATVPQKTTDAVFITLLQPYRTGRDTAVTPTLTATSQGYEITAALPQGELKVKLDPSGRILAARCGDRLFTCPPPLK